MPLSDDDLIVAQSLIDAKAFDEYEIEQIYGQFWEAIPNPTTFGRWFKRAVIDGRLKNIEWVRRSGENHQIYRISGT